MYSSTEKICSFYASELHLTTILMQYIYEKTKEGINILSLLEKDLIQETKSVLGLFNCEDEIKEKIENIGWNKTDIDSIKENEASYNEDIIIIAGSKNYIDKVKESLSLENKTIVDCYELLENAEDAMEIIKSHDYMLMTNGVKKTNEILV